MSCRSLRMLGHVTPHWYLFVAARFGAGTPWMRQTGTCDVSLSYPPHQARPSRGQGGRDRLPGRVAAGRRRQGTGDPHPRLDEAGMAEAVRRLTTSRALVAA